MIAAPWRIIAWANGDGRACYCCWQARSDQCRFCDIATASRQLVGELAPFQHRPFKLVRIKNYFAQKPELSSYRHATVVYSALFTMSEPTDGVRRRRPLSLSHDLDFRH